MSVGADLGLSRSKTCGAAAPFGSAESFLSGAACPKWRKTRGQHPFNGFLKRIEQDPFLRGGDWHIGCILPGPGTSIASKSSTESEFRVADRAPQAVADATEDPPFGGLWCDQPALFLPFLGSGGGGAAMGTVARGAGRVHIGEHGRGTADRNTSGARGRTTCCHGHDVSQL
jgi:hypothetical protein